MDFSTEKINGRNTRIFESESDSEVEIVFTPGVWNMDVWKHQLRYFSKVMKTFSFERNSFEVQKDVLEQLLDERLENAVLVSHAMGNTLSQEMEYHENVVATVNVAPGGMRIPPRKIFNLFWMIGKQPKIAKKLFFSSNTDYRTVESFTSDLENPSHSIFRSFSESGWRSPVKNSLILLSEHDRFFQVNRPEKLRQEAAVRFIRGAGAFPFYERPQDFNKAVKEFIDELESFVKSRQVSRTREKNRSLKEFEKKPRPRIE